MHTLLYPRPYNQPRITRRRRDKHASRIRKAPTLRHALQPLLRTHNVRRIPALTGAKHLVAGLELGCLAAGEGGRGL